MPVHKITSMVEMKDVMSSTADIVVIQYIAGWSDCSKLVSPVFYKLSEDTDFNTKLKFYEANLEESRDISEEAGISYLPVFKVFHKGVEVDQLIGANPAGLWAMLAKAKSIE